jgi:cobalt/nickel transport system permease protein
MAVMGPWAAAFIYRSSRKAGLPMALAVFLAACLGDLMTYVTTAVQLGLAFPAPVGGVMASITKFAGVFAVTQIPLAISEGLLTMVVFNFLSTYSKKELKMLQVLK